MVKNSSRNISRYYKKCTLLTLRSSWDYCWDLKNQIGLVFVRFKLYFMRRSLAANRKESHWMNSSSSTIKTTTISPKVQNNWQGLLPPSVPPLPYNLLKLLRNRQKKKQLRSSSRPVLQKITTTKILLWCYIRVVIGSNSEGHRSGGSASVGRSGRLTLAMRVRNFPFTSQSSSFQLQMNTTYLEDQLMTISASSTIRNFWQTKPKCQPSVISLPPSIITRKCMSSVDTMETPRRKSNLLNSMISFLSNGTQLQIWRQQGVKAQLAGLTMIKFWSVEATTKNLARWILLSAISFPRIRWRWVSSNFQSHCDASWLSELPRTKL